MQGEAEGEHRGRLLNRSFHLDAQNAAERQFEAACRVLEGLNGDDIKTLRKISERLATEKRVLRYLKEQAQQKVPPYIPEIDTHSGNR